MSLNNTAKNIMLDALGGVAVFVSGHSADPGTTGASELTGGTYARKSITWNAAATGNLDSSNAPVLDVPSGSTLSHVGLWSLASGGTFYGFADVTDENFGADGTYTVNDFDISL